MKNKVIKFKKNFKINLKYYFIAIFYLLNFK